MIERVQKMATEKRKKTKIAKRCTIDLTTSAASEVERMQNIFDLSVADVFRYSLVLLSTYADAVSAGKDFSTIDPKNPQDYQIIKLPMFRNVSKSDNTAKDSKEADLYK